MSSNELFYIILAKMNAKFIKFFQMNQVNQNGPKNESKWTEWTKMNQNERKLTNNLKFFLFKKLQIINEPKMNLKMNENEQFSKKSR